MTTSHLTPYSSKYASKLEVPKYQIPKEGSPADSVYQVIRDELDLDGKPNLNLASFVGTYLEPTANSLMMENLNKNLADNDEYPAMLSIHERCISMLASLWGARKGVKAVGSATTGSSEAVHLGGLAMKRRWQEARQARGKDSSKPNIIMGANAQVALLKFARYFDVEARILPVSKKSNYCLDPDLVKENVDENTIGVFVILGSTYTGHYEPVEEISKLLDEFEENTGIDIPIHVDAASAGFVAPFTYAQAGGPKWNFELPRVKSINASGHKYGLVTPGVGWIIWRDESFLPQHLIFELHYLGGTEKSFTLNFSRPGAHVIIQYYNLVHLGFEGYREIMENCLRNARVLSKSLEATKWYTCLSDIHRANSAVRSALTDAKTAAVGEDGESSADYVAGLPVVSFRFSDEFKREFPHIKQESVSLLLRARQWIIPNYALPPREDQTEILRICVRESMNLGLLDRLISDVVSVTQSLIDNDKQDLSILKQQQQRPPGQSGPIQQLRDEAREESEEIALESKRLAGGIHRTVC
ncbi:putative glutamate decarboxylase protein [Eutypa lata UCREL1]|uniref:Glutamate decarboxylase n=1 Tax=Eutypa lata (strain UCR-EL1) TaxID=1287681 RepID=M7SGI1_EUTLA|nr:putative glutamate decarboxylase protein [Eutypa lata UCREL1]